MQNWTDGDLDYCYCHSLIGWDLGGHVPRGVTAHGSPGGPLQFGRLEAAFGRQVPLRHRNRCCAEKGYTAAMKSVSH